MSSLRKGLVMGTFDVLHFSHLDFLKRARNSVGVLIVGVNSDDFVRSFKGEPVMNQKERMYALQQLGYSVHLNKSSGREMIEEQCPDVIISGSDWAEKDFLGQIGVTQSWLDSMDIGVLYLPYVYQYPMSTTEIKRRIREQS